MRTVGSTSLESDAASSRELPRVFWVNQGFNYDKEREGGYVRAPQKNSSGGEFSHWKRVSELKPGDLLIHYAKGVRALGRVTAEAFVTENSEWQAAVEYFPLKVPIAIDEAMADFLRMIQPSSGPITIKRSIKQGYLWDFTIEGLAFLRNTSQEQWPPWAEAPARDQRAQQQLKSFVGMESQSLYSAQTPPHADQEPPPAYGSDVAIVTVIQPELFAALEALGIPESQREKDAQGTVYFRGSLRSQVTGRDYRLVVTCVGGTGNYDASAAAYEAIAHHRPRVLILMGIAAGIQGKVRIGEVVLSERVVAYEPGAIVSPGDGGASTLEHRPEIDRLPHSMNQDVITYRPNPSRLNARFRDLGGELPAAPAGKEEEFRSRVTSTITARAATIASGEKLLRDPAKLRAVRQEHHGKVEVGEMEAAGLVAACRRANIPWLVIRGVSDFGDQFKDDRFHHFASRAAAVVLADFLAHGLTLPENPPTGSASLKPALTPQYPDVQTRHLVGQLEGARARKKRLQSSGANTSQVDQEILSLRRQLREGGQLRAGGWLGHGDRYLLIEAIGRGGFGTIWKAIDQKTQTIVAIKVLHTNLAGDPDRRDRFFRGARRMAELQHPAVVRVLEQHGEEGGFHYFVMEYVAGGNLRQAVLQRVVTPDKLVPIILRIGEVLALGHSKGIIHRDVKPANILLDEQAHPLLTDFDLVGAVDTTGGTRTGALGTLVYAAPECLERPQDADARADVYGLGMTAIFGFHGAELPFHQLMRNPERFLDQLSCPPPIKSVLRRATSLERGERYKDAGEFIAELHRAQNAPEIQISMQGPLSARFPKPVLEAYRSHSLAFFIGSGLSLGRDVKGNFPTWSQLPHRLLDACERFGALDEQVIQARRGLFNDRMRLEVMLADVGSLRTALNRDYQKALNDIFRPVEAAPGLAHRAVARLGVRAILTTNYDGLLEMLQEARPRQVYTWKESALALSDLESGRNVLLKVHGTAERHDTVVMTEGEYRDVRSIMSYQAVLGHLLQAYTFLFIGYGMNDPLDLDLLLKWNADAFKSAARRHYALLKDPSDTERDRYEREYNVRVIPYNDHAQLPAILEELQRTAASHS